MTRRAYTLEARCTDTVGIVAAVTGFIAAHRVFENGNRTLVLRHA